MIRQGTIFLFAFLMTFVSAMHAQSSSVPSSRLAHLQHGVNLSAWFAQVYDPKGYTKEHFETWTTSADIALIRSAGFDHVRLSVNPQPIMDASRRGESERYFDSLDAAMKMILDAGLAVELDMHPDWELTYQEAKQGRVVLAFHAGDESEARRGGELLAKAQPLRVEHFDRTGKRM